MSLQLCDLQVNLGGSYTLFLKEDVISQYSGMLKKMIDQGRKRRGNTKNFPEIIEINDFPGGPDGFEMVARFCYNNGRIAIDVANVSLLYCCSVFLEMTEEFSSSNLLLQTEKFLEGMLYWSSWNDILFCLKSCEPFLPHANSNGLVQKLICALLAEIAPSCSYSPEKIGGEGRRFKNIVESNNPISCRKSKEYWWFDDLTILGPQIIEKLIKNLGNSNSLIHTRFLLHYLKTRLQISKSKNKQEYYYYLGLAETAVQGVILFRGKSKSAFSCRKLFWVLRILSEFSISRESRMDLESLIGEMLDQATLDDLLIPGYNTDRCFYDVDLVIRLLKVFVCNTKESAENIKTVGNLIDKYLREISPDQNLKVEKFLGVAEILPDSARDCFDDFYRAIDIYLESHPNLSTKEKTELCRYLNYEKLTLETCKELAKNPKIPPNVAVEALKSQKFKIIPMMMKQDDQYLHNINTPKPIKDKIIVCRHRKESSETKLDEGREDVRMNLEKMQWRVEELEEVCKEMKVQMSRLFGDHGGSPQNRALPRLC